LTELINERKFYHEKNEKRDLLSNLVNANEEFLDDGEQRLGEVELVGMCQYLATGPFVHSLLSRERFRVLSRWTRGKDILVDTDRRLVSVAWQTTGHTLCFALNMLAVYQEQQEALYQSIQEALPDGRPLVSVQVCRCRKYNA